MSDMTEIQPDPKWPRGEDTEVDAGIASRERLVAKKAKLKKAFYNGVEI